MELPHFKWPHFSRIHLSRIHLRRPHIDWSQFNSAAHEPRVQSHRWAARQPYWTVGAIAGFGAGGILMLLELAFSAATGTDPWRTPRLIAAMLMGDPVLQAGGYSLSVLAAALTVHYVLGAWFGLVMAALMAPFRLDSSYGMALLAGAVFGSALYLFNFYVMAAVLPWFVELRGWSTVLGHVVFGMAAALIYRMLEQPARLWLRRGRVPGPGVKGERAGPDESGNPRP